MAEVSEGASSTAATGCCAGSAPAAWPTSGWPRTRTCSGEVALKVLHRRFAQDREFVERFRREAEAAAGLQHPNIVSVFDRGDVRGHLLHRHAVRRGPDAEAADRQRPHPRAGGGADPPGARGGELRPPQRDRPPRPEAAERDRRRRGQGGGRRLRHRPRRRLGDHPDRLGDGHPALPLARAGAGLRRHLRLRPLLDRGDPLRGADRAGSVRGRIGRRGGDETGLTDAAATELDQPRASRRRSTRW